MPIEDGGRESSLRILVNFYTSFKLNFIVFNICFFLKLFNYESKNILESY